MRLEFLKKACVSFVIRLQIQEFHSMYVVHPEEHQFAELEVITKQILPAALGADENLQGINRMNDFSYSTANAGIGQLNSAMLADGSQKLKEQLAVQGVQDIVVLEPEIVRHILQLVQQEGTYHTQRVGLCEECQRV